MESAMKTPEEMNQKQDRGLNGKNKGLQSATTDNLMEYATDMVAKVRNVSSDAMKDSIGFVKRYPIHTALGAVAVGFFAGYLLKSRR